MCIRVILEGEKGEGGRGGRERGREEGRQAGRKEGRDGRERWRISPFLPSVGIPLSLQTSVWICRFSPYHIRSFSRAFSQGLATFGCCFCTCLETMCLPSPVLRTHDMFVTHVVSRTVSVPVPLSRSPGRLLFSFLESQVNRSWILVRDVVTSGRDSDP